MGNFLEEIIEDDLKSGRVEKIHTRFPPEPNGYLHIGHAKAICLNYALSQKYNGKFNLRFDDTNPVKEEDEYVQSIIEDVRWLGADGEIFYASDYFDVMYDCAMTLIKKGLAYIDDITPEKMRETRGTLTEKGKESPNRNRPVNENIKLFEDMKNGLIKDGGLVLRAKIDMASPNMNMRDPIIYRVLRAHHHRQGDKFCIYPMYDFAHPIEDAVENISHSICTLEFEDHRPLYDWVLDNSWTTPRPHQYEFARLNIERTVMSKRYLKKLVDEKFVDGWDDPRMPTIAGFRRKGYTPSSIRKFCERIGVAKANSEVEAGQLESCIRDELNETAERAMAVLDPIELIITNLPENYEETLEFEFNLPNGTEFKRMVEFSNRIYIDRDDFSLCPPPKYKRLVKGGRVRLKSAYIVECDGAEVDSNGLVTRIFCRYYPETKSGSTVKSDIKAAGVIHWVDAKTAVDIELRLYDYLLDNDKSGTDFSLRLNKDSLKIMKGKGENRLKCADKGERFQFLRSGYYIRDTKYDGLVFNRIVTLKDGFK